MNLKSYVPCHLILQTYVVFQLELWIKVTFGHHCTIEISLTLRHYSLNKMFPWHFILLNEEDATNIWRSKKINCMSECTEMYWRIFFTVYGNLPKKTISKVIWAGKGALDAILSQINKKIGDRFHFQWHRRRLNYQFSNYVTDKVNGSRVQRSLFREDQRPDPGDGGNRAYCVTKLSQIR